MNINDQDGPFPTRGGCELQWFLFFEYSTGAFIEGKNKVQAQNKNKQTKNYNFQKKPIFEEFW